jgi:hypothetical protein
MLVFLEFIPNHTATLLEKNLDSYTIQFDRDAFLKKIQNGKVCLEQSC